MKKRFLWLEDGSTYQGEAFGANQEISGEVVFSTGMVGYPEALTDPSYQGQILVLTYPLIGNYGVPASQETYSFESKSIKIAGLIVSSYINQYSHWQAVKSLDTWLKKENIPAISDIDTRSLTIKLRERGVMLGAITNHPHLTKDFINPNQENLVEKVSLKKPRLLGKGRKKILLIDCGVKVGILDNLLKRDTTIYQVPWCFDPFNSSFNFSFKGVVISNGPGDPKLLKKTIQIIKKLLKKKVPLLGICLGHQILALASGGDTYKMKYGHRSHNQPVILHQSKKCFLTTQNHGFVVNKKRLPAGWQIWFTNLNDGTIEGIRHQKFPFMAVQFHPEGRPGPDDTNWIFDEFLNQVV